jgi:outer membrane protein assembly factor BamB
VKNINNLFRTLFCLFAFTGCISQQYSPEINHEIKGISEKTVLLWSRDNIYPVWSTFDTTIDASNQKVCFLGGLESTTDSNLICLNSLNGDVLWQTTSGNHTAIAVELDAVFVTYRNIVGVRRYNSVGQVDWEKHLSGTSSNYLYIVDNQVQVLTIPEKFWILDFNGIEIKNISGDKIFMSTPNDTFIVSSGVQIRETDSRKIIWDYYQFDDVLEMAPVITSKYVLVRTGQSLGSIFALNRTNGKLIWKTDNNIISNITYSPSRRVIYALTREGNLLAINENDGSTDVIVEFSSVPFIQNGETSVDVGSYQLAFDTVENILFVSLGDSRQLFAFEEK